MKWEQEHKNPMAQSPSNSNLNEIKTNEELKAGEIYFFYQENQYIIHIQLKLKSGDTQIALWLSTWKSGVKWEKIIY